MSQRKEIMGLGSENELQISVLQYIRAQYPGTVVYTNPMSGMKLHKLQAARIKRLGHVAGFPDLMIFEPRGDYHGFFLELKAIGKSPFKKNGELRKDSHIENQASVLRTLASKGYYAVFAVGFAEAKDHIDSYMNMSAHRMRRSL